METEALVLADRNGVIRYWSDGAQRRFGHTVEQAIGRSLDLVVPHELRAAHWKGFHHAMETGGAAVEGQPIAFPVLRGDGSIVETPARLTLVRKRQGEVVAAIVVFGDAAG